MLLTHRKVNETVIPLTTLLFFSLSIPLHYHWPIVKFCRGVHSA